MIWPGFWMLPLPTAGTPPRRARRGVCSSLPTWPLSRNSSGTSTPRQVVSYDKYSPAMLNIACFGLLSEQNIRDMSYQRVDPCPFTLLRRPVKAEPLGLLASWDKVGRGRFSTISPGNQTQSLSSESSAYIDDLHVHAVLICCRILEEERRGSICRGAQRMGAACTAGVIGVMIMARSSQRQA